VVAQARVEVGVMDSAGAQVETGFRCTDRTKSPPVEEVTTRVSVAVGARVGVGVKGWARMEVATAVEEETGRTGHIAPLAPMEEGLRAQEATVRVAVAVSAEGARVRVEDPQGRSCRICHTAPAPAGVMGADRTGHRPHPGMAAAVARKCHTTLSAVVNAFHSLTTHWRHETT
jgi:hypothetical protein